MANRTLFEALTGYEAPDADTSDEVALLGGATPEEDYLFGDRSEAQFDLILERLQAEAETDPAFARKLAAAFDTPADPALLREHLAQSRKIVAESGPSDLLGGDTAATDYETLYGPELLGVPADFSDRYVEQHVVERYRKDLSRIDLRPTLTRFEDDNALGILGWLVFNGPEAVKVPRSLKPPFREQFGRIPGAETFRRHGADGFVYPLTTPAAGERTRIALFADFGTGLPHSRFIARQLGMDGFDAAVHLGDVYYTGTKRQYDEYFEEPLEPTLENGTKLFVIPDNHDGYSGFHSYVEFLDHRPEVVQQGSYFAIETPDVQLIGVDTIWHSDRGRIQDSGVRSWLKARLTAGRGAGRANILLTGHEPYAFGNSDLTKLNEDVLSLADGSIDLWFWGNTHYCALFDRGPQTPFYGSCIGHAGYPYKKKDREDGAGSAAPVLFVEAGSRYEPTEVRKDRGMNGYCSFEIEPDGGVELRYIDWRGHERCVAKFARQADGGLRLSPPVADLTLGI